MKQLKIYFAQFSFLWALRMSFLHLINKVVTGHYNLSFSQSGEDKVYTHFVDVSKKGFYIDIGANEPINLSNTFFLYNKGWRGITIDADLDLIKQHRKIRIKDRAICAALAAEHGEREFFQFEHSAYNTLNEEVYNHVKTGLKVVKSETISTVPLNHILIENNDFIPAEIDLLSIDVEGLDFEIIRSLDFDRFSPKFVIIEMHNLDLSNLDKDPLYKFMLEKKYRLVSYVAMNGYFQKN
jgi:FkbM family methyltransferase